MSTASREAEREKVLAQREAFAEGVRYGKNDFVTTDEIARRYPLPKRSVPRVAILGRDRFSYRVVDGVVQFNAGYGGWLTSAGAIVATHDDAKRLLELFESPTVEVDDDGSAT